MRLLTGYKTASDRKSIGVQVAEFEGILLPYIYGALTEGGVGAGPLVKKR
jgi:hypothetical protein